MQIDDDDSECCVKVDVGAMEGGDYMRQVLMVLIDEPHQKITHRRVRALSGSVERRHDKSMAERLSLI